MLTSPETVIRTPRSAPVTTYLNPLVMWRDLYGHRRIIGSLGWRDVEQRYRGSILGLVWAILHPLVLLGIYTVVFNVVMKARWNLEVEGDTVDYALPLFCGLIAYNLFAEAINRAPGLIVGNTSYVKKVVFPLQALPATLLVSTLVFLGVGLLILVLGVSILGDGPHWTMLLAPLTVLPLVLFTLGISLFLASLGVFVRDIGQAVPMVAQMLFFATPVIYPLNMVEQRAGWLHKIMLLNPLAGIIESMRAVMVYGRLPNWGGLLGVLALSVVVAQAGYAWFMKTRRGFADVI